MDRLIAQEAGLRASLEASRLKIRETAMGLACLQVAPEVELRFGKRGAEMAARI
jgi:hypothetical protein